MKCLKELNKMTEKQISKLLNSKDLTKGEVADKLKDELKRLWLDSLKEKLHPIEYATLFDFICEYMDLDKNMNKYLKTTIEKIENIKIPEDMREDDKQFIIDIYVEQNFKNMKQFFMREMESVYFNLRKSGVH